MATMERANAEEIAERMLAGKATHSEGLLIAQAHLDLKAKQKGMVLVPEDLLPEVNNLCLKIVNAGPNTKIKGEIESVAFSLAHHPCVIGKAMDKDAEPMQATASPYDLSGNKEYPGE